MDSIDRALKLCLWLLSADSLFVRAYMVFYSALGGFRWQFSAKCETQNIGLGLFVKMKIFKNYSLLLFVFVFLPSCQTASNHTAPRTVTEEEVGIALDDLMDCMEDQIHKFDLGVEKMDVVSKFVRKKCHEQRERYISAEFQGRNTEYVNMFIKNLAFEVRRNYLTNEPKYRRKLASEPKAPAFSLPKKLTKTELESLRLAAEGGDAEAHYQLGKHLLQNMRSSRDHSKIFEHFSLAAQKGHGDAIAYQGKMYYRGQGIPKNMQKAGKLFQKASDLGSRIGKGFFAGYYLRANQKEWWGYQDDHKAFSLIRESAHQGDKIHAISLARIHAGVIKLDGIEIDFEKALEAAKLAKTLGNINADFFIFQLKKMRIKYELDR